MAKNLPIKIFQKRRLDERKTEGSGSNTPPKWQLNDAELSERAELLLEPFDQLFDDFRTRPKTRDFIPATLKVYIDDNAIAKSHRKDIQSLFNGKRTKNNVIGFIDSNSLLVKVDNLKEGQSIRQNIANFRKNAKSISAIQVIEIFSPQVIEFTEDVLKVSLIDYHDFELNNAIKVAFTKFCQELNLNIKEIRYSIGLIIFKIEGATPATLDQLSDFEALEAIDFMPKYKIVLDAVDTEDVLDILEPKEGVDYPIIGVLDTGISDNKYLKPWLTKDKFSSYPDELINSSHGTGVSSVIIYCQSNLEVKFGTYDNIKDRGIEKTNILNEFGPDDAKNILLDSNYKSAFKKDTESDYARERVLLNYGKKYQPVKKYSVNLNEMTNSNKEHNLESTRKWYAKITGTYRDFAETLAQKDGEILNQDFTLVVTIKDNKRQHNIYDEVTQLLENRNFLHSNIKLREDVRIRLDNDIDTK